MYDGGPHAWFGGARTGSDPAGHETHRTVSDHLQQTDRMPLSHQKIPAEVR